MEQLVPSQDLPNIDLGAEASTTPAIKRPGGTEQSTVSLVPQTRGQSAKNLSRLSFDEALKQQLPTISARVGLVDASGLVLTPARETRNGLGQRVVTFQQRLDGVEIFRGDVAALFANDNRVVATSGVARTQFGTQGVGAFSFDAAEAVTLAYADLAGQPLDAGLLVKRDSQNGYSRFSSSLLTDVTHRPLAAPARAKRVLFPVQGSLVPSWYVEVELAHPTQRRPVAYSYVISASPKKGPLGRGTVLLRNNLVSDADLTFRVWADTTAPFTPHDGPTGIEATPYPRPAFDPNAPYSPYVPPNLVTIPRAPRGEDPWLPEGATTTSGNNVVAYADLAAPDYFSSGDLLGAVSAPDTFDYLFDPTVAPGSSVTQRQAAIAQLFFTNNWLHDTFYEAGFDEAAKNAQLDNYGRGGVAGDPVEAQAQDYSGTDNANMLTPADGVSPRMQMYVFNGFAALGVEVSAPADIAGDYAAGYLSGGASVFSQAGEVVRGIYTSAAGCSAVGNPAEVAGKIVLVSWVTGTSGCSVATRINAAMASDALGIILEFNADPSDPDYVPNVDSGTIPITKPTLTVSMNTAAALEGASAPAQVTLYRDPPETDLDGTVDNAIVAHEWGHYLTNRLVGNGSGLTTKQARGMGEGWGDFVALLTLVRAEDAANPNNVDWAGAFPMSTYATRGFNGTWASYFGIRRTPYSTDRSKNALTFKHIDDTQALPTGAPLLGSGVENSQVHNAGEVWATALWEAYVSLLKVHPFADAQSRMRNYLVAGLKLTPVSPTFTEARDALLAAALAHDAADYERMGAAFASRGMGVGAVSAPRTSTTNEGVIESYSTGAFPQVVSYEVSEDPANTCDRDALIDNDETAIVSVTIRNTGYTTLQAGTLNVTGNVPGTTGSVATPSLAIGEEATVQVTLNPVFTTSPAELTLSLTPTAPGLDVTPVATEFTIKANMDFAPSFVETVDLHPDRPTWTSTVTPATAPTWDYAYITEETADDLLFYGPNNGLISDLSLVTPEIQVGSENFSVTFDQAFSFEAYVSGTTIVEAYDGAVIELSTDGTTWVDVGDAIVSGLTYNAVLEDLYGNPLGGREAYSGRSADLLPDFVLHATTLDFGTTYAGQTVQLRFRVATDEAFEELGWIIDNVTVSGATSAPFLAGGAEDGVCKSPHTVDAGADQTVDERTAVNLAASVTDPDGSGTYTYAWTQTGGTAATLTGADTATPSFTAPEVTADTALTFEVTVSDADFSATDSVTVTVRHVNRAPTAFAGEDGVVNEREVANIIGTGADADNDAVSFQWTQIAGPEAISAPVDDALLSFVAPEVTVDTDVTFRLTVSDGTLSATDDVTYTVRQVNRAPTVTTSDVTVNELTEGSLTATGVDADGDALTYSWTQTGGTALTLVGANTATPTFTAPEVTANSTATFEVSVTDGSLTAAATATVTILQVNVAPTVSVPASITGRVAVPVTVPVTAADHEGDALSFTWTQVSGEPTNVEVDVATGALTLTPTVVGDLVYEVVVSDGSLSASASVTITAVANILPVLTLVGDEAISADEGSTIELSVTAEDEEGDTIAVTWTQLSGPPATLSNETTEAVTVVLPQIQRVSDVVVFQAVGNDGFDDSEPVTVTVTIVDQGGNEDGEPTVSIEAPDQIQSGGEGTLTATGHDPQGGPLTYVWKQVSGSPVELHPENGQLRIVVPRLDRNSTATFQVTVTSEASGLTASATASTTLKATPDDTGCGCTSASPASMLPAGLAFLAFALRRRRGVSLE